MSFTSRRHRRYVDRLREAERLRETAAAAGKIRRPCAPYPGDCTYKTIGLWCPRCNTTRCWRRYLSWEKAMGIDINQDLHPAELDEDHC